MQQLNAKKKACLSLFSKPFVTVRLYYTHTPLSRSTVTDRPYCPVCGRLGSPLASLLHHPLKDPVGQRARASRSPAGAPSTLPLPTHGKSQSFTSPVPSPHLHRAAQSQGGEQNKLLLGKEVGLEPAGQRKAEEGQGTDSGEPWGGLLLHTQSPRAELVRPLTAPPPSLG